MTRFRPLQMLLPLVMLVAPASQAQIDLGGLKVSSAIDLLADLGIQNPLTDGGRARVRGFELSTYAPVDQLLDAQLTIAGHDASGQTEIELHEAFVASSRLIPRTRVKAGRFFLGAGRLNQFHSHDWPFTSAPKSHTTFFSDEGVNDTGLEVGHLLGANTPIDLVAGVTNGWTYGDSATGGRRPLAPTHYLHPTIFFSLDESDGMLVGLTYLGRTDADSVRTRLTGFDLTRKKRVGKRIEQLLQTEVYYRTQSSSSLALEEEVGGYVFAEWSIGEDGLAAGIRLDGYSQLSLTDASGGRRGNLEWAAVPQLAYRASEFSTLRCSYHYGAIARQDDSPHIEQRIDLQLVALFGAHPSHDF